MFTKIKQFFTRVGVTLGIIQELQKVTQLKKIPLDDSYYERIRQWKDLHRGYDKGIHCVNAFSIDNGSHQRDLESLNMPKVAANKMANLIFNERASISITANDSFDEFVYDIFKRNGFNANFQQYLEFMFAQGGLAIVPYINGDKIDLQYVTAESFIPISWDNDKIKEALIPSYITKDKKYYTLLTWYVYNDDGLFTVRNELYSSANKGVIGTKVPLSELYPDLTPEVVFSSQVDRPLFVYFKPNSANNLAPELPLGISLYGNSYSTLKTIDTIYDSFLREFKLGRKRIIVPSSAIKATPNPDGTMKRFFDAKDETYEAIDLGGIDGDFMKEVDSTLRIDEHVTGLNAALNTLSLQMGVSPGTFSFDATGGLKTATEVISENSETFRTKKGHENLIEGGITELIEVIALLGDEAGFIVKPTEIEVNVQFDDSIIQDRDAQEDREIKLIAAGLQSKVDAIMNIYGLTEEEALSKLRKITDEQTAGLPDVETLKNNLTLFGPTE